MKKSIENFLSKPIAHRGLHNETIAENSLKAFRMAVERDYGIEFDVHLTKDEKLVVIHDSDTRRTCDSSIVVEDETLATIKSLSLKDGQKIPTLDEVLSIVDGKVPLVIELKCPAVFNKKLADNLLSRLENYTNKSFVCLESFHPICVRYLKKHTDVYAVGQLATKRLKSAPAIVANYLGKLKMLRWTHPDFVCYNIAHIPNKYVSKVRKKGMPVLAYTIDNYEKLTLAKNHTDNFIFEKIDVEKDC